MLPRGRLLFALATLRVCDTDDALTGTTAAARVWFIVAGARVTLVACVFAACCARKSEFAEMFCTESTMVSPLSVTG
jgi:hypothetical protein